MASCYITIQGDTWDIIALKALGSEMYMNRLIEANIDHADTVVFSAGISLVVPDIPPEASATLPPWKR